MTGLAPYAKAVVGFIAPAATLITAAVLPSSPGGEFVTQGELITAVCACIITAAAVWGVPNRASAPPAADGRHEAGADAGLGTPK